MSGAAALKGVQGGNALTADFDYKSAARAILPRLAATTHESDRLRRLSDDAANALKDPACRA